MIKNCLEQFIYLFISFHFIDFLNSIFEICLDVVVDSLRCFFALCTVSIINSEVFELWLDKTFISLKFTNIITENAKSILKFHTNLICLLDIQFSWVHILKSNNHNSWQILRLVSKWEEILLQDVIGYLTSFPRFMLSLLLSSNLLIQTFTVKFGLNAKPLFEHCGFL